MACVLFIVYVPAPNKDENSSQADSSGNSTDIRNSREDEEAEVLKTPVEETSASLQGAGDFSGENGGQGQGDTSVNKPDDTSLFSDTNGLQKSADLSTESTQGGSAHEADLAHKTQIASEDNNEKQPSVLGAETAETFDNLLVLPKAKHDESASNVSLCSFLGDYNNLLEMLKSLLKSFDIRCATWTLTEDNKFYQVTFIEDSGEKCETIINTLAKNGIGKTKNSSVSVLPISIHVKQEMSDDESGTASDEEKDEEDESTKSTREQFVKSIKSRLTVAQVVESVRSAGMLTFDYVMLIGLASIIACLGLVENSSVVLVASMLISPLMGPILACTFGIVIKNAALRNQGMKVELSGLFLCLVMGFLCGLVTAGVNSNGANWGSTTDWPTNEMKSRGMARSLWVGVLVALPSGAGVALSVLGGNAGSLVGVAISASLLPPAVNAGMLWAYAMVTAVHSPPTAVNVTDVSTSTSSSALGCPSYAGNTYQPVYSCIMATEAGILGAISLTLTLLNIACIFFMGVIVLKIKEVAPHTAATEAMTNFWKKDIKTAREYYSTIKTNDTVTLGKKFKDEWNKINYQKGASQRAKTNWAKIKQTKLKELTELVQSAEQNSDIEEIRNLTCFKNLPMHLARQMSTTEDHSESKETDEDMRPYRTYTHLAAGSPIHIPGAFRFSNIYDTTHHTLRLRHTRRHPHKPVSTENINETTEDTTQVGKFTVTKLPTSTSLDKKGEGRQSPEKQPLIEKVDNNRQIELDDMSGHPAV